MPNDALEAKRNSPRAIRAIMERYGVDEKTARDEWNRILDTIRKLKETHQ